MARYRPTEEERLDLASFEAQELANFVANERTRNGHERFIGWTLFFVVVACLLSIAISLFR